MDGTHPAPGTRIFHIASPDDAERLERDGRLEPSSLGTEGFVHCSTQRQVVATTGRYFPPDASLVLIELDLGAVADLLRWPEVRPDERFPHLHGPILPSYVVAVHPWTPTDRARWRPDSTSP